MAGLNLFNHACEHKGFPSVPFSSIVPQGKPSVTIEVYLRNEDEFWTECQRRIDEVPRQAIGQSCYDTFKLTAREKICPYLLLNGMEFAHIKRFNLIQQPTYMELESLPAKWVEISNVISNELGAVREFNAKQNG